MVRGATRAHPSASWEEILDLGRVEGPPTVALVLCELGSLELSPAQGEAGGRQGGESEGFRAASWTKALRSSGEQSCCPPTSHHVQTHQPKARMNGFKSYHCHLPAFCQRKSKAVLSVSMWEA